MSDKGSALDVWIVESNTVYREVPFTVVADWLQQGRLLPEDQAKVPGTNDWQPLGTMTAFVPYVPKPEAHRAEDQAEALEPVEFEFNYKKYEEEDDDVDMIPLIDISLVLLIFFMMSSTVAAAAGLIDVPFVQYGVILQGTEEAPWIGMDRKPNGQVDYSFGLGSKGAAADNKNLTEEQVLARLDAYIKEKNQAMDVQIRAHKLLPYETIKQMTIKLSARKNRGVREIFAEVTEKETQ